jgi:hypothetical protein
VRFLQHLLQILDDLVLVLVIQIEDLLEAQCEVRDVELDVVAFALGLQGAAADYPALIAMRAE